MNKNIFVWLGLDENDARAKHLGFGASHANFDAVGFGFIAGGDNAGVGRDAVADTDRAAA